MNSAGDGFHMSQYLQNLTPDQDHHPHSSYQYTTPPSSSSLAAALGIPSDAFGNDSLAFQLPSFLLGGPTPTPGGGADALPGSFESVDFGNWFGAPNSFPDILKSTHLQNADVVSSKYQQAAQQEPVDISFSTVVHNPPHNAPFDYSAPGPPLLIDYPPPVLPAPVSATPSSPPSPQFAPTRPPANNVPIISPTVHLTGPKAPPLYSTTGFDMLGILARVASRANPSVILGPVDLSCSFVVVDVRRYDHPIVYASPTFFKLTGYEASEVIGRNCRFLQSPDGQVQKGSSRTFTDERAVAHLAKSLSAGKECQANLMNYRKGGVPFLNLVSVIPISWDNDQPNSLEGEITYHVGFQVDLVHQPNAILQTMKDGTYLVNYSTAIPAPSYGLSSVSMASANSNLFGPRDKRGGMLTNAQRNLMDRMYNTLKEPSTSSEFPLRKNEEQNVQDFHIMLLDNTHDFIHVLSVKGVIQYFSPSLLEALEYSAEELIGRPISHIAHPQDLTPVTRELKEASSLSPEHHSSSHSRSNSSSGPHSANSSPKMVHLMFRVRRKRSGMVWLESSGRLHVEPGKTRKSIIFSGRVRELPNFTWGSISLAGGLGTRGHGDGVRGIGDMWARVSVGTLLVVWVSEYGAEELLGIPRDELVGMSLAEYAKKPEDLDSLRTALYQVHTAQDQPQREVVSPAFAKFSLTHRSREELVEMEVAVYPSGQQVASTPSKHSRSTRSKPSTAICQFKIIQRSSLTSSINSLSAAAPSYERGRSTTVHASSSRVYEELDVTRGTNWNYELETVRQSNEKLRLELKAVASSHSNVHVMESASRRGSLAGDSLSEESTTVLGVRRSLSPSPVEPHSAGPERKRLRFDSSTQT